MRHVRRGSSTSVPARRATADGADARLVTRQTHIRTRPVDRALLRTPGSSVVVVLIVLALGAGLVPRWTQLGNQSLWTDERFSYLETTRGLRNLLATAPTEIHTPFYADCLYLWNHLLVPSPAHTRALSALCTSLAILAAPLLLRHSPLGRTASRIVAAMLATSTLGFLYGQETRPYGMLWAASAVLTLTHVNLDLADLSPTPEAGARRRGLLALWTATALLASASHLFGLLLAGASIVILIARRRVRVLPGLATAALAAVPQAVWILHGELSVRGFAAGADDGSGGKAPTISSITSLVQDVFGWGSPSMGDGGFRFTSPLGLLMAVAVGVAAVYLYARRSTHDKPARPRPGSPVSDDPVMAAAGSAGLLALVTIVMCFALAQLTPIWTERNLIVVDPALRIGIGLLVAGASLRPRVRTGLVAALLAVSTASMSSVAMANRHPWKTDFRDATGLIMATRGTSTRVGGDTGPDWAVGTRWKWTSAPVAGVIRGTYHMNRHDFPEGIRLTDYPTLWLVYLGPVSQQRIRTATSDMIDATSRSHCRAVEITGIAAMYCTAANSSVRRA